MIREKNSVPSCESNSGACKTTISEIVILKICKI